MILSKKKCHLVAKSIFSRNREFYEDRFNQEFGKGKNSIIKILNNGNSYFYNSELGPQSKKNLESYFTSDRVLNDFNINRVSKKFSVGEIISRKILITFISSEYMFEPM